MKNRDDLSSKEDLFEYYLGTKEIEKQEEMKNELLETISDEEFLEMLNLEMEIATYPSVKDAFRENPTLKAQMNFLTSNASTEARKNKAFTYMLDELDSIYYDTIYYYPIEKSGNIYDETAKEKQDYIFTSNFIHVYPNPSTGKVNLDFQQFPDGKMDIQIVDLTGKVVYENSFENTNGELIDLSEVHIGLFLIKILIDKQVVEVQKLELK